MSLFSPCVLHVQVGTFLTTGIGIGMGTTSLDSSPHLVVVRRPDTLLNEWPWDDLAIPAGVETHSNGVCKGYLEE